MAYTSTRPANYIVYVLVNGDLHRVTSCSDTQSVVGALAQYLREKEAAPATDYYSCAIYATTLISPALRSALLREAEHYV